MKRFLEGEEVAPSWESFQSIDAAFRAAPEFTSVPTFYLVLPSRSRWTVLWNNSFHERGEPRAEESVELYGARRKRDRLNEVLMAQLLGRLGAFPWSAEFYAIPEQHCSVLRRVQAPPTVVRRWPSEVLRAD